MQRFYAYSHSITLTDKLGRTVKDVAVYDETLFSDYLLGLTLRGERKACDSAKKAIYQFLEHWDAGERTITVTVGEFNITTYPAEYLDDEEDVIHLGKRPVNPLRDIRWAIDKTLTSIEHKSPNAAHMYEKLQDILKKYPTLPSIKEKA